MAELSSYAEHLLAEEKTRYKAKISELGEDPYLLTGSYDIRQIPNVSFIDILQYLVLKKSVYADEEFRAYKSIDAHKNYRSGFLKSLEVYRKQDFCVLLSQLFSDPNYLSVYHGSKEDHLKKWKSLEGDETTFQTHEPFMEISSDEKSSCEGHLTPNRMCQLKEEEEEDDTLRLETEDAPQIEIQKCDFLEPDSQRFQRSLINYPTWERSSPRFGTFSRAKGQTVREKEPDIGRYSQEDHHRDSNMMGAQEVVSSSYPLLRENFSLLEKFKKERDLCRRLESDMMTLEGQIQNVSRSFDLGNSDYQRHESGNESEGDYSTDANPNSPHLSNSYEHLYEDEPLEEDEGEEVHREHDPLTVIENTFSQLLILADRLNVSVRESGLELLNYDRDSTLPIHTYSQEWMRMERQKELMEIPKELVELLNELQSALRSLLNRREWEMREETGHRSCYSPGSSNYRGFSGSQVIVPTVRAIFTQVGDSIELRPIESSNSEGSLNEQQYEQECIGSGSVDYDGKSESSGSSHDLQQNQVDEQYEPEEHSEQLPTEAKQCDNPLKAELGEEITTEESDKPLAEPPVPINYNLYSQTMSMKKPKENIVHERSFSDIGPSNYQSSEIIKRIERLQELVRPELCESLKQRALKIQKAKEEFLSGVTARVEGEEAETYPEQQDTDIVVKEISALPNGLTVKEEEPVEDRKERGVLPFLRKKKRDISQNELCTESLTLDDKSDWLRNPFRPKGKYKISK